MKRKFLFVAAVCAALVFLTGCGGSKADFRNAKWGDNQNAVTKSESTEYVFAGTLEGKEVLYFNDKMYDRDAEIFYTFEDSALREAQVHFLMGDTNLVDIMADYQTLSAALSETYGAPLSDDYRVWDTDSELYEEYKNDPENMAIYWRILTWKTEWKTETSYYRLTLGFNDAQYVYELYACSIDLAPV